MICILYLHKINSALVRGGRKATHVPNHSAAQSNEGAIPIESMLEGGVPHFAQYIQVLVLLTIRENDCLYLKAF